MTEWQERFKRQADWQKTLRTLSWSEKIRMVEKVKDSIRLLRVATFLHRGPSNRTAGGHESNPIMPSVTKSCL
ncbi:hypothetical protein W02_43050 [Nitrospira sp. KM1]|nr:hypothetical protein W02_43050 [Nitrospira sp. KM1]